MRKNNQSLEHPIILAIESSCDDTSVAILAGQKMLSNKTYNQDMHQKYGGVVPEVASRSHQQKLTTVVQSAIDEAGISLHQLDAVAVTRGPGLIGSLMVGVSFAKGLVMGLQIPLIEVHHMHAHILAHFIDDPKPDFPFLCLTVSGGHTQIVRVDSPHDMVILGQTLDDAAGEAFDKTGKLLDLPYPAGPVLDRLAKEGEVKYTFPEPKVDGLDFSFSGLKTAILYFLRDHTADDPDFIQKELPHICASVQHTIIEILMKKLITAAEQEGITEIAIAGGVSANSGLRSALEVIGQEHSWHTYIPAFQYCTDNAGMIAKAAYYKYLKSEFANIDISPSARLEWQ